MGASPQRKRRVTRKIYIVAVDPGTTTGVACTVLPLKRGLAWPALETAKIESFNITGPPGKQGWEIMSRVRMGYDEMPRGNQFLLVFESFTVRLQSGQASRKELLDPVRVTSACDGLAYDNDGKRWIDFSYQEPSSKSFATNERLRSHGLWIRGASDHRHDAIRHVCKAYADIVSKYAE